MVDYDNLEDVDEWKGKLWTMDIRDICSVQPINRENSVWWHIVKSKKSGYEGLEDKDQWAYLHDVVVSTPGSNIGSRC